MPTKRIRHNHDQAQFDLAVELLNSSKRPLILAGRGIMLSNAVDTFQEFVHASNIPVAMTLLGIGCFPATDPLNLGMMGMHGEAWVNNAIQEADLLIAVGMRFDDRVTGDLRTTPATPAKFTWKWTAPKSTRMSTSTPPSLAMPANPFNLLPHVTSREHTPWLAHIRELKGDSAVRDIQSLPDTGHLYAAHVINDLWKVTGGNAIVVTDVGQHQMWEAQYYHHRHPRSLVTSGGLGTMGFALPAAIGAKFANPDKEVWVVVGDGGFQMTSCELATIVQEKIDIKIAIINNGFLGMVRQWQEFFYDKRYVATPMVAPDFVALANAYGIRGERITARKEVVPNIESARKHSQAVLLDFRVEQEDSVYPMVAAGASLNDMIRRPNNPLVETATEP